MRAFHSVSSLPRAALVLNQLSRIAHVQRGSNSRSLPLAAAQTGWREVATQVLYRLNAEQLDRCEAVGATLWATSRATNTGTRKQTRTLTQTNQLKGKRGIWTWVREPKHDISPANLRFITINPQRMDSIRANGQ